MKLKVCGMRYDDNIQAIAAIKPDYMGFIFYEGSSRHVSSMACMNPTIGAGLEGYNQYF